MRYATGEALAEAPFTLTGSMTVTVDDSRCVIESSVVLPGGKERTVRMEADAHAAETAGCLRFTGSGPIDALVSEIADDTVLLREVERETGRQVMSASMQLRSGEIHQVAHELSQANSTAAQVTGIQMWTFVPEVE